MAFRGGKEARPKVYSDQINLESWPRLLHRLVVLDVFLDVLFPSVDN